MNVEVNATTIKELTAPYELVKTMRASILVLGPMVAHFGKASVSLARWLCHWLAAGGYSPARSGSHGCRDRSGQWLCDMPVWNGRLKGARIVMDVVTVTGTENLMMAAALADGTTVPGKRRP